MNLSHVNIHNIFEGQITIFFKTQKFLKSSIVLYLWKPFKMSGFINGNCVFISAASFNALP